MDDETYRRIVAYQNDLLNAWGDARDLEREAAKWPGADEIASRANEAVSALEELSDAINTYLPES